MPDPTRCAALLLAALPATVHAAEPAAPAKADDALRMSDFTVTADNDRGYAASETMSGSRVATKIIDLPYTVNVLTSEFFADFAIFELNDSLTQIGSFGNLSGGGGFTLRGFLRRLSCVTAFTGSVAMDEDVDRIEVIKGSNAAIYGRTSPGG
jgi:outer membrane receptor protein involved in Fe transport